MYQIEGSRQVLKGGARGALRSLRWPTVSTVVILLGLNSFLTDISAEMVSTVLPLYLLFSLHLAPVQFGLIDGLYQGGSVLVGVASGFISDRRRQPKEVATVGYGLSALCKLGLVVIQGPYAAIAGLIMVDRIGKGIRTAPRDALISLNTPVSRLGTAFGVHRALDTAGAMLGPLIAFGVLAILPDAFDVIFVISFCFAILGFSLIALFVRNPPAPAESENPRPHLQAALRSLNTPSLRLLALVGGLLGLTTMSDAFVYLALQDHLAFNIGFFPLLFVATAVVYMVLALPFGRLADRLGRGAVFLAGYGILALVYVGLLLPLGAWQVLITITLLGTYYAMTDGVLMALASGMIQPETRATGLGLLSSITGLTRLFASVIFGVLWTVLGIQASIAFFLVGLLVVLVPSALAMTRLRIGRAHA